MAPDALEIAIRADEAAKAAHHRLDRMNGSIDRLTGRIDTVLNRLERSDGRAEGEAEKQRGILGSTRFWQSIAFGTLPVILGLVSLIVYLKVG